MMEPRSLEFIQNDPATPKTQLVIVTGLLILGWLFYNIYFVYVAGIVGLVSFIPALGNRLVWGWYKLAEGLGWFNSRVLLSLVYYLIVTPIGLLFRLFGNDPLKLNENRNTVYNSRDHVYTDKDLENPW